MILKGDFSFGNNSKEHVFWNRFDKLEARSADKTVIGQELKDLLVASNQFFVDDAYWTVEDKVKEGKLELVDYDLYKRKVVS